MKPASFFTPFILLLTSLFSACESSEIGESKDVSPETIYQQYQVTFNEADKRVELYAQFRFAGDKGTTLVLSEPSEITFDGAKLTVDSSEFEGAFYKKEVPLPDEPNQHQLIYKDINKRKFTNAILPADFRLLSSPDVASRTRDLKLLFAAPSLGPGDEVEIKSVDSDSSFVINHLTNDASSYFLIPKTELQRQKSKTLKLVATLTRKKLLQEQTPEGGRLEIIQVLKPIIVHLY